MFAWSRRQTLPGWVGCVPQDGRATYACVERGAERPAVRWTAVSDWDDKGRAYRALRREHRLDRRRNVALLASADYRLLQVDAPDLPREEWRQALRWQLKSLVDFPVEAAGIDLLEIPPDPAGRRAAQVLAVAAPQTSLEPLIALGDGAGAPWTAIDVVETALRNISALVEPEGRAQALLHFDGKRGVLVLTFGGELLLARHFDVPLDLLDGVDSEERQSAFDRAGLELQRTLDGFERVFNHLSLSRLLVSPGVGLDDFRAFVGELTYVPVLPLALDGALDLSAVPALADPAVLARHLCAIGAALRED